MPSLKQNLVVVAMLASTASFSVWALPPQPATTVNYCQGGVINSTLSLHTNLSHYTYTSGLGCVVGANRLLNISGEPLQYTEPNNTAPVKVEFIGGRVESGGAITLRAPDFGFVNLMVPWVVDVKDNEFGTNAIVHFHGCMPLNSRLTISGNTFAGATAVNPRNPYFGIGAIALGVYDPQFTNPLHFRPGGEIVIADNIIKELRGTMGSEATGIMVVPASYFLADRTRMIVRNNSITAVGTDTAPIVPYNLKGYINVLPEYEGNDDIYFEFSNNHADVQKGMAWWLPGLWGPRGAQNLRANITNNRATIDNVISTEKYACISSVVNCSKGASLNFERNEVSVKGSEGVMMFFEVLSEDSTVRIADNKFTVEGANNKARVTSQPFWGVKKIDMTGNQFVSAESEVILQIGAINGTNMEGVVGRSRVEGMAALITFVDILMDGGKLAIEKMEVETRGNAATLNVQRTNLKGDAEARFREWNVVSLASAVTVSFSSQINVQDNAVFGVEANNFTAGVGDSILNLANLKLKNSAVANIEGNRIWATRGSPFNLYTGGIEARDESALRFTFNNLRRTDSNLGMQNNFMHSVGDVNILDRAELGVWNNSYTASNNTLFVGLFAVQGNTTVGDEANIHFCFNNYFGFSDPSIVLKVIPELLANLTDCEKLRWTPPTTTTAEPTTNATEVTSTTEQDGSSTTTGVGATTSRATVLPEVTTTLAGENGAARHLAGAVAVAFSVASFVFAAML